MTHVDGIDKEAQVKCSWCGSLVYALFSRYESGKGGHYHIECSIEKIELSRSMTARMEAFELKSNKPERVE